MDSKDSTARTIAVLALVLVGVIFLILSFTQTPRLNKADIEKIITESESMKGVSKAGQAVQTVEKKLVTIEQQLGGLTGKVSSGDEAIAKLTEANQAMERKIAELEKQIPNRIASSVKKELSAKAPQGNAGQTFARAGRTTQPSNTAGQAGQKERTKETVGGCRWHHPETGVIVSTSGETNDICRQNLLEKVKREFPKFTTLTAW